MIQPEEVREILERVPADWKGDTKEQAQLRSCLIEVLTGHDDVATVKVCYDLIVLMRDQLMTNTAILRRSSAQAARQSMTPKALAEATGQTPQTIARLLTESRAR